MEQTIKEVMGLVDAHKDAQAGREYGKLPKTRAAIEARIRSELEQHMQELHAYEVTVSKLRSELEAIGAGGVEPLRKCAGLVQIQEPQLAAPLVGQQGVSANAIAGAIYDFAGYLTTLPVKDVIYCSEAHEASPMVEAIKQWSKKRNLCDANPDVQGWRDALTTHTTQQGLDAQDLDAWECEKCNGTGIHTFAGYGDSPRGQYPITEREECDGCDATGWCGPDAALAAQAKQGGV